MKTDGSINRSSINRCCRPGRCFRLLGPREPFKKCLFSWPGRQQASGSGASVRMGFSKARCVMKSLWPPAHFHPTAQAGSQRKPLGGERSFSQTSAERILPLTARSLGPGSRTRPCRSLRQQLPAAKAHFHQEPLLCNNTNHSNTNDRNKVA